MDFLLVTGFILCAWHMLGIILMLSYCGAVDKSYKSNPPLILIEIAVILGFVLIPFCTIFSKRWHKICEEVREVRKQQLK